MLMKIVLWIDRVLKKEKKRKKRGTQKKRTIEKKYNQVTTTITYHNGGRGRNTKVPDTSVMVLLLSRPLSFFYMFWLVNFLIQNEIKKNIPQSLQR